MHPDRTDSTPLRLTDVDDSDLVELARHGETPAFEVLARRYQAAALRLAYAIVGDLQDAEDVAQDALLKAHRALAAFRPDADFQPWFLQIVANEARNRRRSTGRRVRLSRLAAAERQVTATTTAPAAETVALDDEQRRAVVTALFELPDEERLAIAARYFVDLSEAQTAELLGCARGTVKSRVSRGLVRLRQQLRGRELLALIAGLLLLGLAALAWPAARETIAERLGLRGATITHVNSVPTPAPMPVGESLNLGPALSLEQARASRVDVRVPRALGAPDAVYATTGQVWLVYAARPSLPAVAGDDRVGLLLAEVIARVDGRVLLGKSVPPGTLVEDVTVGSNHGYWIAGAPHLFLVSANGLFVDVPPRLAGNTLLWEQGGVTLRLEAAIDRDAALRIAESVSGTE